MLTEYRDHLMYVGLALTMVFLAVMQKQLQASLALSTLINTDQMFYYANMLLLALGPVVLISIGFSLAKYIISFVQRIFSSL